jgi:preprotein translocase subunit SecA
MASSLSLVARKVFGSRNDRELKRMRPIVAEINQLEADVAQRSDDDLRAKIAELKARISAIENRDERPA